MLLLCIGIYFFSKSATGVIEYLGDTTGLNHWLIKLKNGWLGFFFTLGGIMIWLLLMFFYFSLFKYLCLIIGSPVFAYLSEKTESLLEGKEYQFNLKQLLKDMGRGIRLALRNSLWQTVYGVDPAAGLYTHYRLGDAGYFAVRGVLLLWFFHARL